MHVAPVAVEGERADVDAVARERVLESQVPAVDPRVEEHTFSPAVRLGAPGGCGAGR